MILSEDKNEIQTNVSASKEFTIKNSAKAFKILSAGLYSDRIKAIIRELSCNAWDAHVMAKSKEAFHVHLPNKLEPWFSVRDYGIGLSETDVMNLYSTYFESTKTESNDQIGALGLGSKSPFSYADSFNVISFFNGERKTYTAHISGNGTPAISKTYEHTVKDYIKKMQEALVDGEEIDKKKESHNGLEVRFAVAENDFDDFAKKAAQVFRIFKVKPEVGGNSRYKNYEQTLTTVLKGKDWRFMKTDFYGNDRSVALQGNIEYPIDQNQLGDLTKEQQFIANGHFYIDFNIGELDISASRESLGYDEPTIENIKNALTRTHKSFIRILNKKVQDTDTLFNAYLLAIEVTRDVGFNSWDRQGLEFKWKNKKFTLGVDFEYIFSERSTINESNVGTGDGIKDDTLVIEAYRRERHHSSDRVTTHGTWNADFTKEEKFAYTPDQLTGDIFLIRDETAEQITEHKMRRKIRQLARENIGATVYFLNEMRQDFFDTMGNPEYRFTSSIELEQIKRNSSGEASYPDNYFHFEKQTAYDGFYTRNCSYGELDEKCGNDITGHYYIGRLRDKYLDSNGVEIFKDGVNKLFEFLKDKGLIAADKQLFAVKNAEKNFKRWETMGWNDFMLVGKDMFAKYIEDNMDSLRESLVAKKALSKIESQFGHRMRGKMEKEYLHLEDYPDGSAFADMVRIYMEAKNDTKAKSTEITIANNIVNIGKVLGIDIEKNIDVNLDVFDMKTMYPMSEFIDDWDYRYDDRFPKLKAYIILVDKSK